jgi:hypothetical protein
VHYIHILSEKLLHSLFYSSLVLLKISIYKKQREEFILGLNPIFYFISKILYFKYPFYSNISNYSKSSPISPWSSTTTPRKLWKKNKKKKEKERGRRDGQAMNGRLGQDFAQIFAAPSPLPQPLVGPVPRPHLAPYPTWQ